MSLAEYFTNQNQYAQAEYLLYAALKLIPATSDHDELRCMVQTSIGHYYHHILTHLVRHFMDETPLDPCCQQKTVDFPSVELKWPVIKALTSKADAVEVFKLGNTQYQKALKFFVCDGFVTEHYRIQSGVSKLYKQLQIIETDYSRAFALVNRRIDILTKIYKEISHTAYNNYIMEISAELSEIYAELHDLRMAQMQTGGAKMTKEWLKEQNRIGKECIHHSQYLIELVNKCVNKGEYIQTIVNMQLKSGNMYSKLVASKREKQVCYLKKNLECHQNARKAVEEHKKENNIASDGDLPALM